MKYQVKTRNWHCKKFVHNLIAFAPHERGDSYEDGDGKFFYESNSLIKALPVWLWWMLLRKWSGGWTYITDDTNKLNVGTYKSFYLFN